MTNEFDITELYRAAFGYIPPRFTMDTTKVRRASSDLGAPYYGKDVLGREYFMPVSLGVINLPLPFISIDGSKTIVETPLVNQNGSVIEDMGMNPYRIRIRGFCVGENGLWPEEQVTQLAELWKARQAYPVESVITAILDISSVVISDFSLSEIRGFKGMQAYQFEMLSDMPIELIVE